jgi:hypothetical protein
MLASLPLASLTDPLLSQPSLQDLLPDDASNQQISQSASESEALSQEAAQIQPYMLGSSEVVYYCCDCGFGPFSWTRFPHCQNCQRRQCSQCRKKTMRTLEGV